MSTQIQDWIRFWLKRNDHEFSERTEREKQEHAEVVARMTEEGRADQLIPADIEEMYARHTRQLHERNQFPVGSFFDMIDSRKHDDHKASTERLIVVAEVGYDLLYEAICTADDEDNAEFFIEAYGNWGPLVDTVLQECDREHRDTRTGERVEAD